MAPGAFGRDETLRPYPHDPVKARALLAEAGYPNGFALDYVTLNDEEAEKLAVSLQADLAEVGIQMSITQITFAAWAEAIGKATGPKFSIITWVGDYPDATNFLDARFHSRNIADENALNDARYANLELDALLDAARAELDPAVRQDMYRRAERILFDDAPYIYDYHPVSTEVTQPYVRGFELHPIWVRDYTHTWLDLGPGGERVPR